MRYYYLAIATATVIFSANHLLASGKNTKCCAALVSISLVLFQAV